MDFKHFLKGIIVFLILNIILLPAYFWMAFVLAMGLGVIEHISIMEKLPFLLISLIPGVIEYIVIYFISYKTNKFNVLFNKYIIGIQIFLMIFFMFGFLI